MFTELCLVVIAEMKNVNDLLFDVGYSVNARAYQMEALLSMILLPLFFCFSHFMESLSLTLGSDVV